MPEVVSKKLIAIGLVELPGVLDLKAAAPLAAEILSLRGRPIDIDASHVLISP